VHLKKTIGRVLILLKAHRLLMHPLSRDEIDDYTKFGLSKWRIQSRRIVYDIRHLIKIRNANDIPDTWNNSTIAHDCLWTITRGVDEDERTKIAQNDKSLSR
jgi:hypothetical protein